MTDEISTYGSCWTDRTKFVKGCNELENRFWTHITKIEHMSRIELAEAALPGAPFTVRHACYGTSSTSLCMPFDLLTLFADQQLAIDQTRFPYIKDIHVARVPFVWP